MIGAQPAQTLSANLTVRFCNASKLLVSLIGGSFSLALNVYSLTVVGTLASCASTPFVCCNSSCADRPGSAALLFRENDPSQPEEEQGNNDGDDGDVKQRFGSDVFVHGSVGEIDSTLAHRELQITNKNIRRPDRQFPNVYPAVPRPRSHFSSRAGHSVTTSPRPGKMPNPCPPLSQTWSSPGTLCRHMAP